MASFVFSSEQAASAERLEAWLAQPAARRRLAEWDPAARGRLASLLARTRREAVALAAPEGSRLQERWLLPGPDPLDPEDGALLARLARRRALRTAADLPWPDALAESGVQRLAMTGAGGFIGRALHDCLEAAGLSPLRLRRSGPSSPGETAWDPSGGPADPGALEGLDSFVHLAGAGVGEARWTASRKALLWESRGPATRRLAACLAGLDAPPHMVLSASAAGYYGDRGADPLDEDAGAGAGYLAEMAKAWEEAWDPCREAGIPVVCLRIGMVIGAGGGVLPRLLLPFRFGLGGPLGDGKQIWSWIALDDLLGMMRAALGGRLAAGAINAAAPGAVPQKEFARILGRILGRPARLPAPAFILRAILGEMADGLLLAGAHLSASRALDAGYRFLYPDLGQVLRAELLAMDAALTGERWGEAETP